MTKNLLRAALIGAAVAASVTNGSPLIVPIMGLAIYLLIRLAIYGMDVTDHALELASARRVAELTWELRTAAAAQELRRTRRRAAFEGALAAGLVHQRAYREPDLITPAYGLPLLCGVSA